MWWSETGKRGFLSDNYLNRTRIVKAIKYRGDIIMAWSSIPGTHRTQKHLEKASEIEARNWFTFAEPVMTAYRVVIGYVTRYDLSLNPKMRKACIKSTTDLLENLDVNQRFLNTMKGLGNVIANSLTQRTARAITTVKDLKNFCENPEVYQKKGWGNKFNVFEDFKKRIIPEIDEIISLFSSLEMVNSINMLYREMIIYILAKWEGYDI